MSLQAEVQMAGQLVKCPGCESKIQIPLLPPEGQFNADGTAVAGHAEGGERPQRTVWKEEDPTNPNPALSVGIGLGLTVAWFAFIYFFQAPPGKSPAEFTKGETLANLFYKHFTVSFANTLFFFWAAAICYLKMLKLKLQRRAMLLDVLPKDLGLSINAQNVGTFIDHVYGLPVKLRDSLMVNRIRKALEFFEVRQNVSEVSSLMSSQSAIDGSRIMGSYILIRAFLWAIPLLGFIGTVIGLSHAISGMSFSNVEDVSKIVDSINSVTSGLGTAFDATLLGLIFAVFLNFPLNSLAKHEEEALNDIDAYCNEVLLPRLDDGAAGVAAAQKAGQATAMEDLGAVAEVVVQALTNAQAQFLTDLNTLSERMLNYADTLEARNEQYQQAALQALADQMGAIDQRAVEHLELIRQKQEEALERVAGTIEGLEQSSRAAYESMVEGQNTVVSEFTDKLGSISTKMETAFSSSSEMSQKAAEDISKHVDKLLSSGDRFLTEKLGSLTTKLETAFSSSSEINRKAAEDVSKYVEKLLTTGDRQFTEKLDSLATKLETAFSSSSEINKKTAEEVSKYVEKLLTSGDRQLTEKLNSLTAKLEAAFSSSSEINKKTAEDVSKHLDKLLAAGDRHLTEKLDSLTTKLENAFGSSSEISQRAADGVSKHLEKLLLAGDRYQEAIKSAESEAVKEFAAKLDAMSAEVQKALSAVVRSVGADSNALQQAAKATQEEAFKQFGERLGSMTKAVEGSVASSMQQAGQVIGGLESGIRSLSSVLEQLGAKQVIVQQVKKRGWFSRD
jgi:biopolymer transport protein ExbB/TolQ